MGDLAEAGLRGRECQEKQCQGWESSGEAVGESLRNRAGATDRGP